MIDDLIQPFSTVDTLGNTVAPYAKALIYVESKSDYNTSKGGILNDVASKTDIPTISLNLIDVNETTFQYFNLEPHRFYEILQRKIPTRHLHENKKWTDTTNMYAITLQYASSMIAQATRRGAGNTIVANPSYKNILTALIDNNNNFYAKSVSYDENVEDIIVMYRGVTVGQFDNGIYYKNLEDGRIRVYHTPNDAKASGFDYYYQIKP